MPRGPRNVAIKFGATSLTHYGGVYLVHRFLSRIGFRDAVAREVRWVQRNNRYTVGEMLLALLYPMILDLERIETTQLLRQNGVFQYLTGLPSHPDATTLRRFLLRAGPTALAQIRRVHDRVLRRLLPETAAIKKNEAKLPPLKYDGQPQLKPIEGTALSYVTNSPYPVVQVGPTSYYALYNAVWFVAPSLQGPWTIATTIPAVIYEIPPSSPLHYVTYVYVYRDTPSVVYVGYTPGYYGTYVSDEVVVYGTGYVYPAWIDTVYYPVPVTYGYAVSPTYTPWTGWVMGFGFGWAFGAATAGWGWGCYPAWGPYYGSYGAVAGRYGAAAWGPGGWAATTGNVYRRWGDTAAVTRGSAGYNAWTGNSWARSAGMSYNSRTGTLAAGQRATVSNVYSGETVTAGRVAATSPRTGQSGSAAYARGVSGGVARVGDNVYATRDGNVYRRTDSGWQQRSAGSWSGSSSQATSSSLNRDAQARTAGQTRVNQYQGTSGARSGGYVGGGGARGGGGRRR